MRESDGREEHRRRRRHRPEHAENGSARAYVLCPVWRGPTAARTGGGGEGEGRSPQARLEEATGLAQAIDLEVRGRGLVPLARPRPATLIGSGKVEEIAGIVRAESVELVIVDHPLTPVQQRNLETAWGAKVLDRTGLILEIFGRRAQTREGRLQVELAHLRYQRSRLVRSWTHLERQRGGMGFLGGPGETQIEADRRVIQDRIDAIVRELASVTRTRGLHRANRRRVPYPIVALVGYTNAGKSTLFNRLTGAEVRAEDRLFATLDPTMRAVRLPGGATVILSDTVGFISDLPTTLVAAFRATLEEVVEADLIVHVRDIADGATEMQRADVQAVLKDLGRDPADQTTQIIEAWNKIDLLDPPSRAAAVAGAARAEPPAVCLSAATGEGLEAFAAAVQERLARTHHVVEVELDAADGALVHWLHENSEVLAHHADDSGRAAYRIRIPVAKEDALRRRLTAKAAG